MSKRLRQLSLLALVAALGPACGGSGGGGGGAAAPPSTTPPSAVVATPAGTQVSDITISYTLSDAESNPVDILVEFSVDAGLNFSPATAAPGGDGVTGLASSPAGTPHTFLWASRLDSVAMAGPVGTVVIRITPSDPLVGAPASTGTFIVDNRVAAFRFSDLDLRDPHIWVNVPILGCQDPTDVSILGQPSLNATIQTRIQTDGNADGNLDWTALLIFRIPDQVGPGGRVDFAMGISPAPYPPTTASLDPAITPIVTPYANVASGAVLMPGAGTLRPYVPAVTVPAGTGFATSPFDWTLTIAGITMPLQGVRIGAQYVGNPATQLTGGLLMGFISQATADATIVNLGALGTAPLSSLLAGGAGS